MTGYFQNVRSLILALLTLFIASTASAQTYTIKNAYSTSEVFNPNAGSAIQGKQLYMSVWVYSSADSSSTHQLSATLIHQATGVLVKTFGGTAYSYWGVYANQAIRGDFVYDVPLTAPTGTYLLNVTLKTGTKTITWPNVMYGAVNPYVPVVRTIPVDGAQAPMDLDDACNKSSVAVGTLCKGGAISLGTVNSRRMMVAPSGCSDSANPLCAGSDIVAKTWDGIGSASYDLPDVNQSTDGYLATFNILKTRYIGAKSAAEYCANLTVAGFSDWHLPNPREGAMIYCHASARVDYGSHPSGDPGCIKSGKSRVLTGFRTSSYWTTGESNSTPLMMAQHIALSGGRFVETRKSNNLYVRCVRNY